MNEQNAEMLRDAVDAIEKNPKMIKHHAHWCFQQGWMNFAARIAAQLALLPNIGASLATDWCDAIESEEFANLDDMR